MAPVVAAGCGAVMYEFHFFEVVSSVSGFCVANCWNQALASNNQMGLWIAHKRVHRIA